MSDQKPRELFLVGSNNCEGPILCVVDSKEAAEDCVSMIKRSNNPTYIHVIEKSAYDELLKDYKQISGLVSRQGIRDMDQLEEIKKLRADLDLAIEALKDAHGIIYTANQHLLNTYKDDYLSHKNTNNPVNRIDETLEKLQPNKGCERCKDWERMGLSNTCPTCDKIELDKLAKLKTEK